jgi:cobalamin biosynthesis protein CobW
MSTKIPATVITGFLGAGKTTLIQNLLRNANGKRLALIINEFGEVGVDGEILKSCGIENCSDDDIIELANGCICCTVADDFLPTIEKIQPAAAARSHHRNSGLARRSRWCRPSTGRRCACVTVDGVIAVVDGPAAAGLFATDPQAIAAQRRRSVGGS